MATPDTSGFPVRLPPYLYVSTPPISTTSPGLKGQWSIDATYLYICIATNSWKGVALTAGVFPIPSSIPNLKAWYKASDFDAIADGTEVTAWNDLSGGGFNTTPLGSAGNRPVVRRSAINSSMTAIENNGKRGLVTAALSLTSYHFWTIFAVVKFTSEGTTQNGYFNFNDGLSGGGTFDTGFGRNSTGVIRYNNSDASVTLTTTTFTLNDWHIIVMRSNGGGSANVNVWIDGVAQSFAGSFGDQSANVGAIRLMEQKNSAGHFMIGQAAEYALFNAAISDADRQTNLEQYARNRYGL